MFDQVSTDYYYNHDWQVLEERKSGAVAAQYIWDLRYIVAPVCRDRDADANAGNGRNSTKGERS